MMVSIRAPRLRLRLFLVSVFLLYFVLYWSALFNLFSDADFQRSNWIELGHGKGSRLVDSNKSTFLRNSNTSQQSNSIVVGTKEFASPDSPRIVSKQKLPFFNIETLQEFDRTDTGSNETLFSNAPPVVSNNNKWLSEKNLQQYNISYSCHDGNKTVNLPTFPHFIIAGVQKAGTTALSRIMNGVPGLLTTDVPEAHFWDHLPGLPRASDRRCQKLHSYFKKWDSKRIQSNTILFEKTPNLMGIKGLPYRIVSLLPHKPKIILILRDPVDRMYSYYKMAWQRSGKKQSTFPSFEEYVKHDLKILVEKGAIHAPSYSNITMQWNQSKFKIGTSMKNYVRGTNGIPRGFYAQQIKRWKKFFPSDKFLKVISYEKFKENKTLVLHDVLKFVGAPSYNFDEKQLDSNLSPFTEMDWYPPMTNQTKTYLKYLYKPFNDQLANLLGESWKGVWD